MNPSRRKKMYRASLTEENVVLPVEVLETPVVEDVLVFKPEESLVVEEPVVKSKKKKSVE